jgi:hypothetical protein
MEVEGSRGMKGCEGKGREVNQSPAPAAGGRRQAKAVAVKTACLQEFDLGRLEFAWSSGNWRLWKSQLAVRRARENHMSACLLGGPRSDTGKAVGLALHPVFARLMALPRSKALFRAHVTGSRPDVSHDVTRGALTGCGFRSCPKPTSPTS